MPGYPITVVIILYVCCSHVAVAINIIWVLVWIPNQSHYNNTTTRQDDTFRIKVRFSDALLVSQKNTNTKKHLHNYKLCKLVKVSYLRGAIILCISCYWTLSSVPHCSIVYGRMLDATVVYSSFLVYNKFFLLMIRLSRTYWVCCIRLRIRIFRNVLENEKLPWKCAWRYKDMYYS